jgi:putative nucleotidyltransferase with HDIG domain
MAGSLDEARRLLSERSYAIVVCGPTAARGLAPELLEHISRDHPEVPCLFLATPVEPEELAALFRSEPRRRPQPALRPLLDGGILSETIGAMVSAIDARDPANAAHSRRVTLLALRLGEALRLSPARMELLELAAMLHDIGKISVPHQILSKPGPLDEAEWVAMKRHAAYGAEIVTQVPRLRDVARVIRHHHERFDGGGYPDGLTGETIPTLSRVISIADAYEAMTADRAYRPAMDAAAARRIIRENLGTQFDPHLGELFLRIEPLP